MTNDEMLVMIQIDRPLQTINKVLEFKENEFGFYDVKVDREGMFLASKIKHVIQTLPYPIKEYKKLSMTESMIWRLNSK